MESCSCEHSPNAFIMTTVSCTCGGDVRKQGCVCGTFSLAISKIPYCTTGRAVIIKTIHSVRKTDYKTPTTACLLFLFFL